MSKKENQIVEATRVGSQLAKVIQNTVLANVPTGRKATYKEALDTVMTAIEINASSDISDEVKKEVGKIAVKVVKNSDAYDLLSQIQAMPNQIQG